MAEAMPKTGNAVFFFVSVFGGEQRNQKKALLRHG